MSSPHQTVHVRLESRSYDIDIGRGLLDESGPRIAGLGALTHAVIICDENTRAYAERVAEQLHNDDCRTDLLTVKAGEKSKSIEQTTQLWNELLSRGTDRRSKVIAVGGGVVGDLAGFIAASFTRGLDFVQVPTSLLAQVDSSVGGKVGINLPGAKNMVGHFWQPQYVLIDTQVLSTLTDREYRCGLAEVIKYGVILDPDFFEFLERNVEQIKARDDETLKEIISACCELKADVVENDERETKGLRAVLNYGHTFAHAFEAISNYGELLHGEAVAIGMLCASRLAEAMGRIDTQATERQFELINAVGLPTQVPDFDHDRLLEIMQTDKKVEHGRLRFILPDKIGHVELVSDVSPELVRQAMINPS